MRIDKNGSVVIETREEREIISEAVRQQIREKEEAETEAESGGETEDAETLRKEIDALCEVLGVLDSPIKEWAQEGSDMRMDMNMDMRMDRAERSEGGTDRENDNDSSH